MKLRARGAATTAGTSSLLRFRGWLVPLLAIVVGVVGYWSRVNLEATLKRDLGESLTTILDSNVAALEIWLQAQRDLAISIGGSLRLREAARAMADLNEETASDPEVLRAARPAALVRELLDEDVRLLGYLDYALVDRTGLIVAASQESVVGERLLPEHLPLVVRAVDGETVLSRPFKSSFATPAEAASGASRTAMFVITPITEGAGQGRLLLGLALDAVEFSEILQIARTGESGETYAFDADGVLLSASRFDDHLRQIGLLPPEAAGSQLNLQIRNPGGNMVEGFEPGAARLAQPLTRMAASAVTGESGVDTDGYLDYRGVPVVGAWRWLDRYGIGVATERDVARAFRALNSLKAAQLVLLGLLVIASLVIMSESLVIGRLGKRLREVATEARQLGQYTLEEKIGEGGMGEVYRASHAMLRRPTAVKLLRPELAGDAATARFEREVQLTSRLTHPNTIAIYDYGRTPDGIFYYAMEYLTGINLQELVAQTGPLGAARVIHVLRQACGSLAEAHSVNLIHRDVKPANMILSQRGGVHDVVKVLDFGIVKELHSGDTQLTAAGAIAGTPMYVAPEALTGSGTVDARADVYALGCVAYFLLTGAPMFAGELSPVEVLTLQMRETPPRPSSRVQLEIPTDLEDLVMRCLSKVPDQRPQSAAVLLERLERLADSAAWGTREAQRWWALHPDLAGSSAGADEATVVDEGRTVAVDVRDREA